METRATITMQGPIWEGKAPEIIADALMAAMYEALALLESSVKAGTPEGVFGGSGGGLRATVHGEPLREGGKIIGVVGHTKPYGDVVEMGRRPGQAMPPKGALTRWIEVKLGMDRKAAERIEYVVRRKIAQKGFKGAAMFESAWENNLDRVAEIFDRSGFTMAEKLNE